MPKLLENYGMHHNFYVLNLLIFYDNVQMEQLMSRLQTK